MNDRVLRSSFASPKAPGTGFTLIEVMIVVAIVGILAAIALPAYFKFIARSRIIEATTALGDIRSQMEKYYMDNRTYVSGGACGVTTYAPDPIAAFNGASKNFQIACPDPNGLKLTATQYSLAATGQGPMTGFTFTVDYQNNKTSGASVPAGWTLPAPNNCWVNRPDGSCD
ncbi:MAG TPA: type IV pilin protein [Casimicrobiaceae bacterium]|jgi:type IV pilus assembly protein PilE|nr:type IV pilin protein [Casimicrobiaceae bacterium]